MPPASSFRLFRAAAAWLARFLAAWLSLAATPAFAVDTSFQVYDGFSETVDAFRLVALIFSDGRYETLVVICGVVGIALGAVLATVRGQGMGIVSFGFQMLFGIGLFVGLVSTTGTVNIYDKVRNGYQAVGSVPNLIVVVAGTTNLMERALAEVIDDNTADPDSKLEFGAGGHSFDLFLNAVSPRGPMTDTFLDTTVKDYVRQCYPVARTSSAYAVDDDQLFRTSTDLSASFAAMASPATYSTVYTSANKGGTTMSCTEAWDNIQTRLSDSALFDDYAREVCQRTGYDVTDANQLTRCKSQLGEMGSMMMGTSLTLQAFMSDIMLGNAVGDVLFEDSPATASRVMANRAVISSGLATMSVANEWMPTIRATVFGIMLFMTPIALLFILTPLNLRVASYTLGLFVFVALWGVIDAGIYQLTLGRAMDALAEMRSNHVAANAWLLAPSSAMKALAIFGSFRTSAAGLAGAFTFTIFRFSGNVFTAFTSEALQAQSQGSSAAAPLMTKEGYASALESQASASGTMARRGAASSFGDFGERSSFAGNRAFGMAGSVLGEHASDLAGQSAFAMGGIDAARELGGLAPAMAGRDINDPATVQAVRANATTGAIQNYAGKDALRALGTTYFGGGQSGEQAFAAFTQRMVQWKSFGDTRAYDMMQAGAQRHFERSGYGAQDAALKASTVIAQASADPAFGKLSANAFDQEQMLRNDITSAQVQAGGMEGRRDVAGDSVTASERSNVATEQEWRIGRNIGQSQAAGMLGISLQDTGRRVSFINTLSGEARASAITQLSRATGRNEAQVERALETYNAASQLGTADGATSEASRERTSIYGRTREAARFDFAERSGKLDAQREVGTGGTRSAARIGEERRQADNAGFAQGAGAAGTTVREAAHLDSFIQALSRTAGNQTDLAEGGAAGVADRGHNERLSRVVENERLTRMQGLLDGKGIELSRREIAMDQNGDLNINLTPATAASMWKAGLINESQLGAIANGGRARFSFAHNDLLVSSSTGFSQSARSDTSTRFEAGKQAGPDTIEHFLSSGPQGQSMMANWLRGGFEMDRKGHWRLKPQVADTLERDVQAIMAQTGWQRSLTRSADHTASMGTTISGAISGSASRSTSSSKMRGPGNPRSSGGAVSGSVDGKVGIESADRGTTVEAAKTSLDIVNYEVRAAISAAERQAARSHQPAEAFARSIHDQIMSEDGLRSRYLNQANDGRGTVDLSAPITSAEQSSLMRKGRFLLDPSQGPGDGNSQTKEPQ